MNSLVFTIDTDWASEAAIDMTLSYFLSQSIRPTIFITHRSRTVENHMGAVDVGLHPYFGQDSSQGKSISEVVEFVMDLPHNVNGFRCHRFGSCNLSKQAMLEAGMQISSNVCTNLELIPPFEDRLGLIEIPIFLEDGGYLWKNHPLEITGTLHEKLSRPLPKIILIHPMHFALNTPNFNYMADIKKSLNRNQWNNLSKSSLERISFKGRGIRDFIIDLVNTSKKSITLRDVYHSALK